MTNLTNKKNIELGAAAIVAAGAAFAAKSLKKSSRDWLETVGKSEWRHRNYTELDYHNAKLAGFDKDGDHEDFATSKKPEGEEENAYIVGRTA